MVNVCKLDEKENVFGSWLYCFYVALLGLLHNITSESLLMPVVVYLR